MTNNESKGPFEGLLVIDMTHVLKEGANKFLI